MDPVLNKRHTLIKKHSLKIHNITLEEK